MLYNQPYSASDCPKMTKTRENATGDMGMKWLFVNITEQEET